MTRNEIIGAVGELIDELRPHVYKVDTSEAYALLGDAERFCDRLCDVRRKYMITVRAAHIILTSLQFRASKYTA